MKLEKLTPEQKALIPTIRDKWINQLYDLKEINIPQLTEGVNWLYQFCKLKKPQIFICKSILEAQILVNLLKNKDNVWANVGNNVGNKNFTFEQLCICGDINDYGWVAFYNFFTEIGILDNKNFNSFVKLLQSNYYSMIQMDKACIVIENPIHILLNINKQLNSTKDYAIKFKDNTGMYFVNGFYLSNDLFNKLSNSTYSFEDFSKESNEEIKSAIISFMQQRFGEEYLFRFFSKNLKEVDTFIDKKNSKYLERTTNGMNLGVYTLFKGVINNTNIAYVRCYCPSTDRMFFLGVNSEINNAKDAIASLCQIPVKLKDNLLSINRQGEMFSFNFDEIGTNLLKSNSLTKEDLNNVVSLKGDEYFSKIKFEY